MTEDMKYKRKGYILSPDFQYACWTHKRRTKKCIFQLQGSLMRKKFAIGMDIKITLQAEVIGSKV